MDVDPRDPDTYNNEIAKAIVVLASSMDRIATQLKYLGTGDNGSQMGAIEFLAKEVKEGLDSVSSAISERNEA